MGGFPYKKDGGARYVCVPFGTSYDLGCSAFAVPFRAKKRYDRRLLYNVLLAKLQNTGPLISILLNNNSAYFVILRSSKGLDTSNIGGPKWPCIL